MNRLIQYGSVEAIPYYNCSRKTFEEWEKTGVKKPWFGWPMVFFGVLVELIYPSIIYIIFKTKLIRHPCYKLIVMLAIIDMSATCCSCLITGPLLAVGAVFCMYPTFIYVAGGFALNTWCMACASTIALFANRIISIAFREYADAIEKKLAYSSMVLVWFYGFYLYVFTPSIVFNSDIVGWLPDPFSEEFPSEASAAMYKNTVQAWNNWIFVGSMLVLFTTYFVLIKRMAKGQKSKASRAIFIQCSVICFFNTVVALIYNALAIVTPAPWILIFGQLAWVVNHACPAIIYITMNETIKREFLKLIFKITFQQKVEDATSSAVGKTTNTQSRI